MKSFGKGFNLRKVICVLCCISLLVSCKKDKPSALPDLGSCVAVATGNGLRMLEEGVYQFQSIGGAVITLERHSRESLVIQISDKAYTNFQYEFWGDANPGELSPSSHENLNGKHMKDRVSANRSIIFPDGTKITMVASAPWHMGGTTAITIYDKAVVHHFNMTCYTLEYNSENAEIAKLLDDEQPDGETSTYEITETGLIFYNIYTEDSAGNKVWERVEIGTLSRDNPKQVNDLYDDPRLQHT